MSLAEFEVIKLLGKGAFASVYQVRRKKDGIIYAMKRVNFGTMSSKEKDNALNEVRILASVQHTNIIGYKESFYDDDSKTLNIIMDYADEGDLDGKLKKHVTKRTNFPENEIWSCLIQLLQGLRALHNAKIMHRDLKSANIFLKSGMIKLGDLNVSKLIKRPGMDHTQTGTPYYASPEVWSDKPYDYKCDIWSVGCIIYEMCALKPPFRANSLEDLFKAITKGRFEPIPKIYSQDLHMMVGILLQVNPSLRPDVHKLLANPIIIKKMDFSKSVDSGDTGDGTNMLKTIKVPRNLKEVNQQLPKQKNYDIGEVIIERKSSEENLNRPKVMDNNQRPISGLPSNNIGINRDPRLGGPPQNNPQYKIGGGIENKMNPVVSNINRNNIAPGGNVNPKPNINLNPYMNRPSNNDPRSQIGQKPGGDIMPSNVIKSDVRGIDRLQDQRADLIKKYNNNPPQRAPQDVRIRPRTPDALPKNNVIMRSNNVNVVPKSNINNNIRPGNIVNPNQVINRNPPMQNPYMIKRDNTPTKKVEERPRSSNNQVNLQNNQNKVMMERNKYQNIMNNPGVNRVNPGGIGGNGNRPVSGIGGVKRPVTPDKIIGGNRPNRPITPDKVIGGGMNRYNRPITPDKVIRKDPLIKPSNHQIGGGMRSNVPSYNPNIARQDRPRTPDVNKKPGQIIIRKK
eukprot:CAMPEP_0170519314 /NCGR_PEP_ID=MMETSP0209-20121228/4778_1 /TAXON_ID=665100 ORGANISM="Litonotus pictus, Strain P1" /NCGR_SAMPLE_ID=MMETSP0209 /ASSEMBLY_ACC=CAM_ASM_000301 /LENGTH=679 /DNA_ID=CAMNT_0010805173 /DNA_START=27 /DNA_END=2066 /DNA_ORIENTATION=-